MGQCYPDQQSKSILRIFEQIQGLVINQIKLHVHFRWPLPSMLASAEYNLCATQKNTPPPLALSSVHTQTYGFQGQRQRQRQQKTQKNTPTARALSTNQHMGLNIHWFDLQFRIDHDCYFYRTRVRSLAILVTNSCSVDSIDVWRYQFKLLLLVMSMMRIMLVTVCCILGSWGKKPNFCSDFEHKVLSTFLSWSSGKIWSVSLVGILLLMICRGYEVESWSRFWN